jgi:2-oxo-4-hydroxy-4-carboxy-5-ureidoimidazoline decarboxylase
MRIDEFNLLDHSAACAALLACCHSQRWATQMADDRPFADVADLMARAHEHWQRAEERDLLDAFSGHARIGDMNRLRDKFSQAHKEQGQVAQADDSVLQALLDLNHDYEQRHGFIFIVCATGKSADEMLAILRSRLPNSRAQELANAAAEQQQITALRLSALFAEESLPAGVNA